MFQFGTKPSQAATDPSAQTSEYLAYLFSVDRTEADLTLGNKAPEVLHDPETLKAEITGQYAAQLMTFATQSEEQSEIDRKRVKRIAEYMQQLPYEQRPVLGEAKTAIPLFMLRAQVELYQHQMETDKLRRGFKAMFTTPKKPQKAAFLRLLAENLASLESKTSAAEVASPEPLLWTIFKEVTQSTGPCTIDEVSAWLENTILPGDGTAQALSWLPQAYIESLFSSEATNVSLEKLDAEILRAEVVDTKAKEDILDPTSLMKNRVFSKGVALPMLTAEAKEGRVDPALAKGNLDKIEAAVTTSELRSSSDAHRKPSVFGGVRLLPGFLGKRTEEDANQSTASVNSPQG